MATRQYIGARYVPKFYTNSVDGSTAWESNVVYEPLTYVTLTNGHMYISKKQVPATVGTPASNVDYWLDVGDYNGFIEELQDEIDTINNTTIPAINRAINDLSDDVENVTFKQPDKTSAIFFGDSITAGDLGNSTIANPTFPQSYGNISGLTITNMGRGGSTAANNPNAGSAEHLNYVATLVNFANYDQCFICHGVNDYNANSPLGGINSTDEGTFMGALQKFIETAYTQNPSIQIVMLGTFWSIHSHTTSSGASADYLTPNTANCTIADYINGARSVANKYNIPFIDMMDMLGVNFKNYNTFLADGIHPKQATYTMIGIRLAKALSFPSSNGFDMQTAVAKTKNTNMVCIGDIVQTVGDFPIRHYKKGITVLFDVNNSYYYTSRRPYPVVSGEPITFHAIAYVKAKSNFYIRLTHGAQTCVLWAYQNNSSTDECFEINRTVSATVNGDCVIEAQVANLVSGNTDEAVYLTDLVINKGTIPDRGGIGCYTEEFTWFTVNGIQTGVSYPTGMAAEFMIDRMGNVRFRGRLTVDLDTFTGTKIAEIPLSFRPQKTVVIPCARYGTGTTMYNIQVSDTGNLSFSASAPTGTGTVTIDLSAISYNIMKQTGTTWPY